MIVWYLTIPVIRKYKEIPVLIVTVALALIAGYFKNIGDFLCMSRILVFGPFFYLGYYMEQPVLERALRPVYRRVVVPAAVAICAGILAFGSKLKDELGMVYENISYYELDDVWEGPFVRLALMIGRVSDFVGDYVFCAAWENLSVSDWTEYDAGIYAAPDPAGYPDVCGNL